MRAKSSKTTTDAAARPAGDAATPVDRVTLDAVAKYAFNPEGWAQFAWDWGNGELEEAAPRTWQSDVNKVIRDHLKDPKTRFLPLQIAVASGHGIGKSAEMAQLAHWGMSCFPDAKIVVTANTGGQLDTKTAPEFAKWFRSSINAHWFDVQAKSIRTRDPGHRESWRVDFVPWSEHNTEAFAGLHNKGRLILLMFDEASKIADKVWEVAEGALTDENTVIIWVVFGNPTRNSGRFRECFRRFRNRWVTRQIDSRDVPGTNKRKIAEWEQDHGTDSDFFKIRVRGQFPEQSALQFIGAGDADRARTANAALKEPMFSFAPKIIGVDPAWTGDDSFEIMFRQGLHSRSLRSIPRNDDDIAMANMIARLEDELGADGVIVDAGFGTGIVSAGRALGRTWHLVWFSGKSPDEGCLNMRAYMWRELRDWLKEGGTIDPRDEVLYQDLIGPETVPRVDGKIQLESKEDMKDRGLPSPNRADALCFVPGTLIKTPNGDVPIELLDVGDEVVTPFGISHVHTVWKTTTNELTTVNFSNGSRLVGKPDHKIFAWGHGVLALNALAFTTEVEAYSAVRQRLWQLVGLLFTSGRNTGFKELVTTISHGRPLTVSAFFIAAFGLTLTGLFRRVTTFITRTLIPSTTPWTTWRYSLQPSTSKSTRSLFAPEMIAIPASRQESLSVDSAQRLGTNLKKAALGIVSMGNGPGKTVPAIKLNASNAEPSFSPPLRHEPDSVQQLARWRSHFVAILRTHVRATGVENLFKQIGIALRRVVPVHVQTENVAPQSVYNLTLESHNAYYANDILVFNCLTFAVPIAVRKNVRNLARPDSRHQFEHNPFAEVERIRSQDGYGGAYDPFKGMP